VRVLDVPVAGTERGVGGLKQAGATCGKAGLGLVRQGMAGQDGAMCRMPCRRAAHLVSPTFHLPNSLS
jgi:hypothetical protein